LQRFEHPSFQIEIPQIIIHKADQPDVVVHFFDAHRLSGKDLAEIDFLVAQTDATATRDHDGFVVERIVDVRQADVGTWGRLVDLCRTLHIQRFMGRFVVEDLDQLVEAGLLLKKIGGGGFGRFFFQGEVHAFVTAVLLGMSWRDGFNADSQAQPPHREPA